MLRADGRPSGRRSPVALAAALGVVLLLALPFVVGVAGPVAAAPTTVAGGEVTWGVKASFRSYVTGPVGQGTIEVSGGATSGADGAVTFPGATGSVDLVGPTLDVAVGGGVRFVAHDGALDLRIADLRVVGTGATGTLLADVVSRDLATGVDSSFPDVALADLDLAAVTPVVVDGTTTWSGVPASLTTAGAAAFADFYPAGTSLDPLTVVTHETPPPTTSSPPTTGPPTTGPPATAPATTAPPTTVEPWGVATATGVDGQRLTVEPAHDLDPAGERVTVVGEGYDPAVGVYVAFCVDRGPGVPPSPCLGGADLSGESESAAWISDDPPPYGVGLAQPYGPGGTFEVELVVAARAVDDDGLTVADCLDGTTRCVVATRADHTAAANRRADVAVPVTFAGQAGAPPAPTTSVAAGAIPTLATLAPVASTAAASTAAGAAQLPATGASLGTLVAGLALLGGGVGLVAASRALARRDATLG